jgi:4-amino-4-deoxy-L-arabinose transferase-like glycosyltransferase
MSEAEQSKRATDSMSTEPVDRAESIESEEPNSSDDLAVAIRDSINVARKLLFGPERVAFGRALGLLAIGCMLLSGYNFWWKAGQLFTIPYAGLNWALAGAVLLFFAIWFARPKFTTIDLTPRDVPAVSWRIKWPFVLIALLILFVVGDLGRNALLQFELPIDAQVGLFVLGGILLCWALGAFRQTFKTLGTFRPRHVTLLFNRIKSLKSKESAQFIRVHRVAVLVIVVTLIGFGLRLWQLQDDVRIMIDEESIYHAINVLQTDPNTPLFKPWQYGPANYANLYPYFARWTILLSGNNDLAGVRLVSVIVGTLTIPALFLLGTVLFESTIGLIAAALLAAYPVHIHFSRMANPNIVDPMFGVLMLAFMVRGFKRNNQSDFVLAGACAALSGYFYEGGRYVFYGLFVGMFVLWVISGRAWSRRRGLILMVFTALIVAFPYFYTLTKPGYSLSPRSQDQVVRPKYIIQDLQTKPAIEVLQQHWDDALGKTFYHTIYSIDGSRFYYGGDTGMLLWFMVPFYLLGLFIALWGFRLTRWLLWVWIGGTLIGISMLISTDWTGRYFEIFPVLPLTVAIGIRYGLDLVWLPYFDRKWKRLKPILYTLLVIALSVAQVNYYFNVHLPTYYEQVRQIPDFYDVFEQAHAYSPSTLVYITDKNIFPPVLDTMIEFQNLGWHYALWSPATVTQAQLLSLPRDKALVFAIWPDDLATAKLLKDYLGVQGPFTSPFPNVPPDKQYLVYVYEPGIPAATPGYF